MISRLRHSVLLNTLIQIYRSLIFPYTYYGIAAWGQAAQVYFRKVFILQKRALRLMFFAGNRSDLMLFPCLSVLMSYHSTSFILKQYVPLRTTYLLILPLRISVISLLVHLTFIHITLDFSDAGNLYVNKSRLRIQLNSSSIFGAKLWNCLKPELRNHRKKPFKNKIHQFLLAVLGNEDDYVDVSTLMLKITNHN